MWDAFVRCLFETNKRLGGIHTRTEVFKEEPMEFDLFEGVSFIGVLNEQLHTEVFRRVGSVPNKSAIVHRTHLVGLIVWIAKGFREFPNVLLLRYVSF